ncbi:MAG: Rieske (2Fe-2S) protein [Actinomycetia bacterium]|nr:Rieske (2Fe-2S) protein [Actinomycetes bacterium]
MIDVGGLDEFPERSVRVFSIEGREVGVMRWRGDEVFAFHNRCPHQGGPLCRGFFGPKLVSRGPGVPGRLEADDDLPIVVCPWHKWEFEAATGRGVWDPNYRVRTYPIKIEEGRVLLGMRVPRRDKPRDADAPAEAKAPAEAGA